MNGWLPALAASTLYNRRDDSWYDLSGSKPAPGFSMPLLSPCCAILRSPDRGEIVVDIMTDRTVSGIELMFEMTGDLLFLEKCEKNKIFVD